VPPSRLAPWHALQPESPWRWRRSRAWWIGPAGRVAAAHLQRAVDVEPAGHVDGAVRLDGARWQLEQVVLPAAWLGGGAPWQVPQAACGLPPAQVGAWLVPPALSVAPWQ